MQVSASKISKPKGFSANGNRISEYSRQKRRGNSTRHCRFPGAPLRPARQKGYRSGNPAPRPEHEGAVLLCPSDGGVHARVGSGCRRAVLPPRRCPLGRRSGDREDACHVPRTGRSGIQHKRHQVRLRVRSDRSLLLVVLPQAGDSGKGNSRADELSEAVHDLPDRIRLHGRQKAEGDLRMELLRNLRKNSGRPGKARTSPVPAGNGAGGRRKLRKAGKSDLFPLARR